MDQTIKQTDKYSSKEYLSEVDKYWRAANYLSVGQLYLKNNPLLRRPLNWTLGNNCRPKLYLRAFKPNY